MRRNGCRSLVPVLMAVVCLAASVVSQAGQGAYVGYRLEEDVVVFRFDVGEYESVSRGETGERMAMEHVEWEEDTVVAVAGDFNGWSGDAWPMKRVGEGVYALKRPLSAFEGTRSILFKFVIDGTLWVEPPVTAGNRLPTGLGNDSHNLFLVLPEPVEGSYGKDEADRAKPEAPDPHAVEGASKAPEPAAIDSPLLEQLTPSAELLGGACSLKPVDRAAPSPIPVSSNPMITSDSRVIGFVSIFVMPPTPEEEASWEAEMSEMEPGAGVARIEELMAERTANVRAAYVAIYEPSEGGAETGIFALEFNEPLSAERQAQLAVEGPGGSVVTSDRVAAAIWTDDRERECFDAVLGHVASTLRK